MKYFLAVVAVLLISAPTPSVADTSVNPDRRNTSVVIEGTREVRPTLRKPTRGGSVPPASTTSKVPTPVVFCKVDADAGTYGCRTYDPAEDQDEPEGRELTEGDIVQAVREIGLPSLAVRIEPGDSTLVNARTNFYTDPEAFARSVELLGFDIDLEASPVRYLWVHGDGTRASTAEPGRRYPNIDVTHRYREPADVVRPRVDVTYSVRYRVDGGAWATLGQTITASGPVNDLEVNEAAPVLTAP